MWFYKPVGLLSPQGGFWDCCELMKYDVSDDLTTDWAALHGEGFKGLRALVTGGAGFIGSHLTQALLELGASVVVIDDLSGADGANLKPMRAAAGERLRVVEDSILNDRALADATQGADLVFHQAALGSVPRSVERPRAFHDVNTTGTLNVLEAARAAGVRRVMFAASSSAYGDAQTLPKVETMAPQPLSPYAATKVAGEALMRAWACSYAGSELDSAAAGGGTDTACLRYFNIFGSRQNANSAYAAVIAAFAKSLLAGEPPVIYGDGTQSRDFTHVHNAVHANLLAASRTDPLRGAVFNVACGQRVTVTELAERMAQMLGCPDLAPGYLPERAGDVKHSVAGLEHVRTGLGYVPIVGFPQGLASTMGWYARQHAAAAV